MMKSDSLKYETPRGVRLGGPKSALGMSCTSGNTDISCEDGDTATAACYPLGNSASGCLPGTSPQSSFCDPNGSSPQYGCQDGNVVQAL